jgi:hypothetical protein
MSPKVCRSNVAYAVPSSKRLASMVETQEFFPSPLMFPTTFVQVFAPSRVICTFPSSVPTQMICPFFGDSEIE